MLCAFLPLLVVSAQAAFRSVSEKGAELQLRADRVRPEVEKSDEKFFGKDYPWDKRPIADKYYKFGHPYPAVQDSGDFDRDFVKDENSDGGRWQAQMEYDTLRSKIRIAKGKLKELKEKMEKEYEDWMQAKDKAKDGAGQLDEAGKDAQKKGAAAEAAQKKVNDLEGHSQKDGTKVGGAIGDAVKKVEDEMSDLEKCKKALATAKKRLKKLMKEKEEYEKKKIAVKEAEEKAAKEAEEEDKKTKAKKEKEQEEKKKAKKEEKKKAAKDAKEAAEEEEEASNDEEAWRRKLEKEKKDHSEALKTYEQELKDVKLTEDQLARAAENLRKFRRPPYVDDDGGVYNDAKSHAFSARVPAAMILAVLAASLAA